MSSWTYVHGIITVLPMGRTQAEKQYILDTVLNHLPKVTGSEKDMSVYAIKKNGYNSSSSCDEYGDRTNNLINKYNHKCKNGWLKKQNDYMLIVDGSLRDREFKDTLKEFNKFICRLSKRIRVEDMLVKISGYEQELLLTDKNDVFSDMFEYPSWVNEEGSNWCEHLMWTE